MAIDNDTSYELTGAQIKDLAQKIRNKADDNTFVGAGTSVAGSRGIVPAPAAGDNEKILKGDGTWGAVTSSNIDWSTFPGRIIAAGQINVGTVSANYGKEATEYIPTQADSNYAVILTHAAQVNGYDKCMPAVKYKYTDRFVANIWNSGSSASGNILLDYVVIKY